MTSCGYIYGDNGLIKSQEYDYLKARQVDDLNIPRNLKHKSKADFTVVPAVGQKGLTQPMGKDLQQAAPIQLLAVLDNTRLDKKSDIPSVYIIDDIDFVWQTVELFFKNHEIKVVQKEKELETNWIQIEEGGIWLGIDGTEEPDEERAKYQVSLSKGELLGEHKLVVKRSKSEKRDDEDKGWLEQRVGWQDSADMMNLILSFYDTRLREQEAVHQQKIMAGFKVELGQNKEGDAALIASENEKVIWEKIPRVMREIGMTILEKDIKQKTYFMEYKAKEVGFFASLFEASEATSLLEEGAYQLSVSKLGEQHALTFRDGQGLALSASKMVQLFPELSRLFGDRR